MLVSGRVSYIYSLTQCTGKIQTVGVASLTSQHVIILLKTCWLGDSDGRSCWFNGQPLWTAMGVGRLWRCPKSDVEVLLYLFLFVCLVACLICPSGGCLFVLFCYFDCFLRVLFLPVSPTNNVLILFAPKFFKNMLDATARKPEQRAKPVETRSLKLAQAASFHNWYCFIGSCARTKRSSWAMHQWQTSWRFLGL